jgi:cell division protein FtsI/penicillin-binding protein 2
MKIRLIFFIFVLSILAVILKLFYIQILSPSISLNKDLGFTKLIPERGLIYDRNKLPLVLNQTKYKLYAEPKKMKEKEEIVEKIDKVLKIGSATLEAKIDDSKIWVSVTSGIPKEDKKKIENMKLKGIGFEDEPFRFYPEASLAAHLLGFVGKNSQGDNVGYFGIEGYYDKDLSGLSGFIRTEKDLLGRYIFIGNQEKVESENGRNLILTIDKAVQGIIKQKLKDGLERYKAEKGCVIVADPNSMEILGLSCLPDFDLEKYYKFSESFFVNDAISSVYEPGSIFKPLIVAAALNEKKIKQDDFYNEKGPVEIGEYTIKTWNNKYEGKISITRILEKSSNVGMVYIGKKLGNNKILQYLDRFGFNSITGIDLQGEAKNYLKSNNQWYPIDYATVTFGQGIAVTPIQMIAAFSSLINGGKLLQPHLVKNILYSDKEKKMDKKIIRQTVSKETSKTIKKMLLSAVEKGEYKWIKPKGYMIGGKTGTAQIPIGGKYESSKTIASFIGFAPYKNPKFIALVILKEPKTSIYGSETAAPIFFDIAKDLFVYYNIAPEQ